MTHQPSDPASRRVLARAKRLGAQVVRIAYDEPEKPAESHRQELDRLADRCLWDTLEERLARIERLKARGKWNDRSVPASGIPARTQSRADG